MRGESGGREPLRDRSSPAPPRTAGTGGREPEAPLERARRPTGTFATRAVKDSAARVAFFVRPPNCVLVVTRADAVCARASEAAESRAGDATRDRKSAWKGKSGSGRGKPGGGGIVDK